MTGLRGVAVLEPAGLPAPVVACLPHGGRDYPAELAGDLAVRPDVLWSDWLTTELYAFLPELGVTTITTTFSRFVADVNRDPATGHGKLLVHRGVPRRCRTAGRSTGAEP